MKFINDLIKKYDDPLYRNSHYLILGNFIASFLGFIFWIMVARTYPTSDVGLSTALISVSAIISILSTVGLDIALMRFLPKEKEKEKLINSAISIVILVSLLLSIGFLLGLNIWAPQLNFVNQSFAYIALFLMFNIFSVIFFVLNSIFIALRDTKYFLFQNVILNFIRIPLPFILILIFSNFGIFASFSIAILLSSIISFVFFTKKVLPHYQPQILIDRRIIKKIFNFSVGNYLVTVFISLPPLIIPLIILNYLTPEQNAYFYIVFTIATILIVIPQSYASSLLAEGSTDERNLILNMRKVMKQIYLLLIPVIIFIILFGDKFLLLFGENYSINGSSLLSIFAIATIFIAFNYVYNTYLRVRMKNREVTILNAICSILILSISFLMIPKYGILWSGLAYLISFIVIDIFIAFLILWKSKNTGMFKI